MGMDQVQKLPEEALTYSYVRDCGHPAVLDIFPREMLWRNLPIAFPSFQGQGLPFKLSGKIGDTIVWLWGESPLV